MRLVGISSLLTLNVQTLLLPDPDTCIFFSLIEEHGLRIVNNFSFVEG